MSKKSKDSFRAGYVTLAGRPNVGKSTLMNALIAEKLAIVSPKPQTTRQRVLGILTGEDYQVILLDTPGWLAPKYLLQKAMTQTVETALADADLILMLTEAGTTKETDAPVLSLLQTAKQPRLLAINKIDRIEKGLLLPQIDEMYQTGLFEEIVPISALQKDGLDVLLDAIRERLPAGEPFYPPDMLSNEPERFFVAELIREQIFHKFEDEIPYATAVNIQTFEEGRPGRKDLIEAVITVERDSQKAILIGKGGLALKETGTASRAAIEQFLERPVFLKLVVRVRKKWRQDPKVLKQLGYTSH
ncbi:MAG: GTPase Era [Deltaproteobacteria bacterium]|nr:GTPase Era [Deltaproteobacteria bacterium]